MAKTRAMPLPRRTPMAVLILGLAAGVLGTSLLFQAASGGSLGQLILGAPLFGAGLYFAGWPIVLATAHTRTRQRSGRS